MRAPTPAQLKRMQWAWRLIRVDFTSSHDYRWPFPGHWAVASGPFLDWTVGEPCPGEPGDGLCLAINLEGAISGGLRLGRGTAALICGYLDEDTLGHSREKLRVRRAWVLDVIDPLSWLIKPGGDLRDADLRDADLRGAYLMGADLRGAYLRGAYLRDADLRGAYLRGAYLGGAYLGGADLRGAYLGGAYLGGAYLMGADLRGAYLRGAYLRGSHHNQQTLWPVGFDPAANGARLI